MSAGPDGFKEFVLTRSPALLRTAWMLTGNAASAEDLLQSALARAWPHWTRVSSGNPDAYVRTVMVRTNASWRSRKWNNERPTAVPAMERAGVDGIRDDSHGNVVDRILLATALARLPVRQRQAVVLRFFDDLSVEAVAQIMGCTTGTVKSQTAKGLTKLREAMSEYELLEKEEHR